jgi:hypothetical protein
MKSSESRPHPESPDHPDKTRPVLTCWSGEGKRTFPHTSWKWRDNITIKTTNEETLFHRWRKKYKSSTSRIQTCLESNETPLTHTRKPGLTSIQEPTTLWLCSPCSFTAVCQSPLR